MATVTATAAVLQIVKYIAKVQRSWRKRLTIVRWNPVFTYLGPSELRSYSYLH